MQLRSGTHRVDVESHRAALHGIHSGLTAGQRSLQRVVGGIDCCFACWVLKSEVGVGKAIRLRKREKKIKWQRWVERKKKAESFLYSLIFRIGRKKAQKSWSSCVKPTKRWRRSSSVFSKLRSTTVSTLWCGPTAPLRRQTFDMWACLKHGSCGKCDYKRAKPETVCCSMQLVR